ncbi:MAG: cell division protein ZapA [Bacteroidales bacterium]|jgi:cell division protein ZapA|nr:cell division protein ZapA [Bacteroidales bacterium]
MEKQAINIVIGGRSYKFQVQPETESRVRDAGKRIEKKLNTYLKKYENKDMQDILSIVLLDTMAGLIALEEKDEISDVCRQLQDLDKKLEGYISGR